MSHNLYTLNSVGGNVFSYHGANKGIIYLGRGESAGFRGTSPSVIVNNNVTGNLEQFEFYDTNPVNTISGASLGAGGAANWYKEFTLPAGTYYICSSFSIEFINNFNGLYLFVKENGSFLNNGLYASAPATALSSQISNPFAIAMTRLFEFSATTTFRFDYALTGQNSVASMADSNNVLSKSSFIFIRKLS